MSSPKASGNGLRPKGGNGFVRARHTREEQSHQDHMELWFADVIPGATLALLGH